MTIITTIYLLIKCIAHSYETLSIHFIAVQFVPAQEYLGSTSLGGTLKWRCEFIATCKH